MFITTSRKNNYFNFLNVPTEWDSLTRCTTTSTSSGKHVACGLRVTLHAFYKTSTQNYYIRSYFIESVLPYEKARNGISATLDFKIFWGGGNAPDPLVTQASGARLHDHLHELFLIQLLPSKVLTALLWLPENTVK